MNVRFPDDHRMAGWAPPTAHGDRDRPPFRQIRRASHDRLVDAPKPNTHKPLDRRVRETALALVDRGSVAGLTMRRFGENLGVEAMSLHNHVDNKTASLNCSGNDRGASVTGHQSDIPPLYNSQ